MAALVDTKYEDDRDRIHKLRLTASFAAVAGTEPTAAVNSDIRAQVSKTKKEFGLRPRGVRLARTVGTGSNTFRKYAFLPLRSKADATSATYAENETVTIASVQWKIVAKVAEDY